MPRLTVVPAKKKSKEITLARHTRVKVGGSSSKRTLGAGSGESRQIKRRKTGPTVQIATGGLRRVKPKTVPKRTSVARRKPNISTKKNHPVEISTRRTSVPENPPAQAKPTRRKRVLQRGGAEKRPRKQMVTKVTIDNMSVFSAAGKSTASKLPNMTIKVPNSPQRLRAVQRRPGKKAVAKRRAVNPRATKAVAKKPAVRKPPVIQTRSKSPAVITTKASPVVKKRVKRRPQAPPPQPIVIAAPPNTNHNDDSSVYSYSSDDTGSDIDGTTGRRSKRALGPVMKAHTVTKGGHIMLRNLPDGINARMMMMELFRDDGEIINAIVHADHKGEPTGTGEIVFSSRKDAHSAIVRHRGSIWRGNKIKMTMIGQMVEEQTTTIELRGARRDREERERKERRKKRKPSRSSVRAHMMVVPQPPNTSIADPLEQEEGWEDNEADAGHVVETQAELAEEAYEEEEVEEQGEEVAAGEEEAGAEEVEYEEVEEEVEDQAEEEVEADFPDDAQPDEQVQDTIAKHGLTYAAEGPVQPQFTYIPTEDHDQNTNFHVTLKNFKEYESQLKDTPDAGIFG